MHRIEVFLSYTLLPCYRSAPPQDSQYHGLKIASQTQWHAMITRWVPIEMKIQRIAQPAPASSDSFVKRHVRWQF
jgi:hypothetical protein